MSQAAADALALAAAQAGLVCGTTYWNVEQTANCPTNYSGAPVVIAAHTYSAATQAEADALALAAAQAGLVCCYSGDPIAAIPDYSTLTSQVSIAQVNQYGFLGFPNYKLRTVQNEANWLICPNWDYCYGPGAEGETTPVPYPHRWGCVLDPATGFFMYGLVGATWVQAEGALFPIPVTLPAGGRISVSFDADALACFAYQFDATTIRLRRMVGGTPTTFSWTGTSPKLWYDGILQRDNWNTDLCCYYITGSGSIAMRMQRDNFAVEYVLISPLTAATKITKADSILSRGVLFFIDSNGSEWMAQSSIYPPFPILVSDSSGSRASQVSGSNDLVIVLGGTYSEPAAQIASQVSGVNFLQVVGGGTYSDAGSFTPSSVSGGYPLVIVTIPDSSDSGATTTGIVSGNYYTPIADGGSYTDPAGQTTSTLSGIYS